MPNESDMDKLLDNIQTLGAGNWDDETRKRIRKLISRHVRDTLSKCRDCGDEVDTRVAGRCLTHTASAMASVFAKQQLKKHGPEMAMNLMAKLTAFLDDEKKEEDDD